jgi:putrescine importer
VKLDGKSPRLLRALKLRDLLLYGLVIITPMAPMPIFGVLSERGGGHVVTAVLIAMIAMLFTSISYGRMARIYPSAGSAFAYVAKEIHPGLGYITGWSLLMDYILAALGNTIWCAEQSHDFVPGVPVFVWKILCAACLTLLNIRSIRAMARINIIMAAAMGAVVVVFFGAAAHYIFGHPHPDPIFFTRPFYDPQTFSYAGLFGCTSIAVLAYLGFDAITTLSEEAENPRRDILLATVLTCVVTGLLSAVEVYVAQLIWPASEQFPSVDTAYVSVAGRAWRPLFSAVGFSLLLVNFASGMATLLGAARLLYGMGRSNALPRRFFGAVDSKHHIPQNNVLFLGSLIMMGSLFLPYALVAETVNFGALIGFMGVNAAALLHYYFRSTQKTLANLVPPALGFLICLALWCNLSQAAKVFGSVWMVAGIACGIWKTRGFRTPFSFEAPEED